LADSKYQQREQRHEEKEDFEAFAAAEGFCAP
jgi:hypothetical protein